MRYILSVFGVIILLLLIVILIVRNKPDNPGLESQTGEKQVVLTDYESKPATLAFKMRGDIKSLEEHRTIRITVTNQERVLEIMQGYNNTVINRQTFPNTTSAYQTLLQALDKAGFSRSRETEIKDRTGICPFGRQYDYGLIDGSETVIDTWDTSCRNLQGNFGGESRTIRRLFEAQIPDYHKLVEDVEL